MRGSIAEAAHSFKKENNAYYYLLSVLDCLFSALVVAPAVVAYWRSIWELMSVFVFPDCLLWSSLTSTAIGVLGHVIFGLSQGVFTKYFHPDKNRILYYIFSRVYTVCFAFVCVNGWRGPWRLLDLYLKASVLSVIGSTLVGVIALASMRALTNVSAPPFVIVMDSIKGYFEVLTMFRVSMNEKTSLYILDCLFSVLVVGTLVVFVWRGGWVLMDILIFPEDEIWSSWSSLVIGYAAVVVAFLLQQPMRILCDKIQGALRLLVADLYLVFSLFATINVWRGIWNLLNLYLLPNNIPVSCLITHCVSWILLVLLGCSNSLLVRGVYIDAEEPAGNCVIFPCYYLRLKFRKERLRKLNAIQIEVRENIKSINPDSYVINTISEQVRSDVNHINTSNITT